MHPNAASAGILKLFPCWKQRVHDHSQVKGCLLVAIFLARNAFVPAWNLSHLVTVVHAGNLPMIYLRVHVFILWIYVRIIIEWTVYSCAGRNLNGLFRQAPRSFRVPWQRFASFHGLSLIGLRRFSPWSSWCPVHSGEWPRATCEGRVTSLWTSWAIQHWTANWNNAKEGWHPININVS